MTQQATLDVRRITAWGIPSAVISQLLSFRPAYLHPCSLPSQSVSSSHRIRSGSRGASTPSETEPWSQSSQQASSRPPPRAAEAAAVCIVTTRAAPVVAVSTRGSARAWSGAWPVVACTAPAAVGGSGGRAAPDAGALSTCNAPCMLARLPFLWYLPCCCHQQLAISLGGSAATCPRACNAQQPGVSKLTLAETWRTRLRTWMKTCSWAVPATTRLAPAQQAGQGVPRAALTAAQRPGSLCGRRRPTCRSHTWAGRRRGMRKLHHCRWAWDQKQWRARQGGHGSKLE